REIRGVHVVVPIGPVCHLAARYFGGADHADARQADDRLGRVVDADHRLHGVAEAAALRVGDLQTVADRGRVPLRQHVEVSLGERPVGHGGVSCVRRLAGTLARAGTFRQGAPMNTVIARGGKAIYGAPLGILMLEAKFPRIPGDMGNAATWPFPVLYRVVKGASPERVVLHAAAGLLDDFLAAAEDLVAQGAEAITTNCGFLSVFQRELAARVQVPVATSALIQVPWVQATLPPGKRVGIITVSAP